MTRAIIVRSVVERSRLGAGLVSPAAPRSVGVRTPVGDTCRRDFPFCLGTVTTEHSDKAA